jgi:hypothetical protein
MKLRSLRHLPARDRRMMEWVHPSDLLNSLSTTPFLKTLLLIFFLASPLRVLYSQQVRMIIDGSIRSTDKPFSSTTRIRILHEDGSIDRTVRFYDPQRYKFGVRLSSSDGFVENENIRFRFVVTAQDSFVARYSGSPLVFKGTNEPMAVPTTRVDLFRNTLPTIYRSLRDTTIKENQLLRYRIVAIDDDDDTVHFALRNAPSGASIDSLTGIFSWIPTFDQAGRYRIRFAVSDGYDNDETRTAMVTVQNVNRPPRIVENIPDIRTREGDTLRFSIVALDEDGDRIYYRVQEAPTGLTIDSLTGKVEWIPSYEQAGNYIAQFLVTDGILSTISRRVGITISNVNRPPVFASTTFDTTVNEDQDFERLFVATDPDRDSIWYSLNRGPTGASLTPSGVFHWRPSFFQAGEYDIVVVAHDQESSVDFEAKVRVLNVNRPPSSVELDRPFASDTVRLILNTPVRFAWSRSTDPDTDDILTYTLHIWGSKLDTTIGGRTDTTCLINIKPYLQPESIYRWNVIVSDGTTKIPSVNTYSFKTSAGILGSVEMISAIPKNYLLEQSVADPFSPVTSIRYALPERSYVKLTIFNMLGESLLVLVSGEKDAGVYDVTFDASEFTSGAYMFRLDAHPLSGNQSKDFVNTKKMFIVR